MYARGARRDRRRRHLHRLRGGLRLSAARSGRAQKIKRSAAEMELALVRSPDTLASVAALPSRRSPSGSRPRRKTSRRTRARSSSKKRIDMIAANQVGPDCGFDRETNALTVFWPRRRARARRRLQRPCSPGGSSSSIAERYRAARRESRSPPRARSDGAVVQRRPARDQPARRVELKILNPRIGKDLPLPKRATAGSAGLDLRACLDAPLDLDPGDTKLIPTGIAIHLADPQLAARDHSALGARPQARHRARQPGRAHRLRLSGRAHDLVLEPRRAAVSHRARRAHRAARRRAGRAGGVRRRREFRRRAIAAAAASATRAAS